MLEWFEQTLGSPATAWVALPAAVLLGLIGAVTSASCSLPVLIAIAGYSGSDIGQTRKSDVLLRAIFFALGTMLALVLLGAATGLISQAAGAALGKYWKFFAGFVLVFFGLVVLGLIRLKLPKPKAREGRPNGRMSSVLWGLALGGAATACSTCCNPALFVALGMAAVQGHALKSAAIMLMFGLGFSIPLAVAVVGFGLGANVLSTKATRFAPVFKTAAGILLIGAGMYMLATAK